MQHIIHKHGIEYHKYADDIQLYTIFDPCIPRRKRADSGGADGMCQGAAPVDGGLLAEPSDDKTEMIMFMSKYHLNRYWQCTINIGNGTITPAHHVCNLGVQVDQHLSMVPHQGSHKNLKTEFHDFSMTDLLLSMTPILTWFQIWL